MNKFILSLTAVLAVAVTVEAAPARGKHPPRREPPRTHHHPHRRYEKRPSWGWGLNFSPGGLSVGVGTRVGKNGFVGVNLPLVKSEPVIREKTVIVQQPVVQQPIIVQQPAAPQVIIQQPAETQVTYSVNDTLVPAQVWVEGHWKIVRDAYGNTLSKTWIPGHWE